jgi:hypothetical protein
LLLLLLAFLELDALEDFFDAAISLTTFHAVRDLPVAPTWQIHVGLCRQLESKREGKGEGDGC